MRLKIIPRRKIYRIKGEFNIFCKIHSGDWVRKFEKAFAEFLGVKHVVAVPCGREGMRLILESFNLKKGDEVLIPAYTLKDLTDIIGSLGLRVIPVDIDLETFNISVDDIVRKLTPRTKVILATHIFGVPCAIDKILEIAVKKSIYIVEDCAHSPGSSFKGKKTGSFGRASFFSFDTIKPVNTYGGGAVATNDDKIADFIRKKLPDLKFKSKIPWKKFCYGVIESKFSGTVLFLPVLNLLSSKATGKKCYDLYRRLQKIASPKSYFTKNQAYLALGKLSTLEKRISERKVKARLLKSLLSNKIIFQKIDADADTNYYFLVALIFSNTKTLRQFLLKNGIDIAIESEIADNCAKSLGYTNCPNAEYVYQHALQIPLYEGLDEADVCYIADTLNSFLK